MLCITIDFRQASLNAVNDLRRNLARYLDLCRVIHRVKFSMRLQRIRIQGRNVMSPKNSLSAATGVALLLAMCSANAGDGQGKIVQIAINKSIGAAVFVRLDTVPTGAAACSTNSYWHFTIPLVSDLDKRLYTQILAAKLVNATVSISGTGVCSEYGSVESAGGVGIL